MVARPIRVLVVDDTSHVREMLTAMLTIDGFAVVAEAADGATAVERIESAGDDDAPDVVVIDYKMPGLDGLATARKIRDSRPDCRTILYTAFPDPAISEAAAEAGVSSCVAKTDGLGALEQEIARLGERLGRA